MEQLKIYLESLKEDRQRIKFARACGTTLGRMQKETRSKKGSFSPAMCVRIEQETKGAVQRSALHPRAKEIWPELFESAA